MSHRGLTATFLLLLFSGTLAVALGNHEDDDGDSKIREAKRRAKEAEEKDKREERTREHQRPPQRNPERDTQPRPPRDEDRKLEADFSGYLASLRFAAYPYSPGSTYFFNTSALILPLEEKRVSLQIASAVANHLDGTWGNSERLALQLSALHLNVYRLEIFGDSESLTVLSANVGVTFFVPDLLFTAFIGGYAVEVFDSSHLAFGFDCQLFLPARVHAEVFSLNSLVGDELFAHLEGTLEVSIWRMSIGAGWSQNSIAGVLFAGPCVKASLWL